MDYLLNEKNVNNNTDKKNKWAWLFIIGGKKYWLNSQKMIQ